MATYSKKNCQNLPEAFAAPYGDVVTLPFKLSTTAGVMTDSDKTTAIIATDVIQLGILRAGTKLIDMVACVSAVGTASSTMDLGFAYVDGEDSTSVPQDADYFADAVALSSAAMLRKATTTAPVTLPKDAYLILTNNSATQAAALVLDINIIASLKGYQGIE